ncbi:MAG: hypothetical protein GY912_10625 [Candidatus Marinimicrobia bacterium]|nr:hypothetical protein [Candidatus Neomarinimicrobiota bacterium]
MLGVIRSIRAMIRYTISIAVLILGFSVFASDTSEENFIDIGMLEANVLSTYGSPANIIQYPDDEEYGMGKTKLITYEGVKLDLRLGDQGYYIWRLRILGSPWAYRNKKLSVGVTTEELRAILGIPLSTKIDGATEFYYYHPYSFDGWATIKIENGVVIEILATEDWT